MVVADADTVRSDASRYRPGRLASMPSLLAVGGGVAFGFLVLIVAQRPTRWLVFMFAALMLSIITIVIGSIRRQLMAYFIIGLSLNLHYYVTQPEPSLFSGNSSPLYYSIPFVLFPAFLLLVTTLLDGSAERRPWQWGFPMTKYALVLIGTALLSALASSVRRYGIYVVVEMLQLFFLFLVVVNVVRSERDFTLVLRLLMATLLIQCVVFSLQTATGSVFTLTGQMIRSAESGVIRASGTIGTNPESYATFIEPIIFMSFALWRIEGSTFSRRWTAFLVTFGGATLIVTLNRTAWITLPLGLLCVELLTRRRRIARKLGGTTKMSLLIAVVVIASIVIPLILPRINASHGDDWTKRYDLMRIATRMIAGNPILGVGPGAYPFRMREYLPPDFGGWLWVVHNQFLLTWAERGLIGFIAWLAWFRAGIQQGLLASKANAPTCQAVGIGCVAGFVGLLWEYMLNYGPAFNCSALLWCLFGLLVAGNRIYAQPASDVSLQARA